MLRRSLPRVVGVHDFVDQAFILNRRPAIPGGAWPMDLLRKKSIADLQQLWFLLLRERNMLQSMKDHYVRHTEELGAMPAPSRIVMVGDSMKNIKQVMRERDNEATDLAIEAFNKRLAKGIYRYPPGPQPKPGAHDPTTAILVTLSQKLPEERVREIFGRFDVFEDHKGIASIDMFLPDEVLAQKEEAEDNFDLYVKELREYEESKALAQSSYIDACTEVELAPGEFHNNSKDPIPAAALDPVPYSKRPVPTDPLERLRLASKSWIERKDSAYSYFPNVPSAIGKRRAASGSDASSSSAPQRPVHPDEITGPWHVVITYADKGGADYGRGLNVSRIDGVKVNGVAEHKREPRPYAADCPIYNEALNVEAADNEHQKRWPHMPTWKSQYYQWSRKKAADIISHNFSNVADYYEREVTITGRSAYDPPIEVDASCGNLHSVPPHAKPKEPDIHWPFAKHEY